MQGRRHASADVVPGMPVDGAPRVTGGARHGTRLLARLLTLGLLVAGLLVAPASRVGAVHYDISWTNPADNAELKEAAGVKFRLSSLLYSAGKVESWTLEILEGGATSTVSKGLLCSDDYTSNLQEQVNVALTWDTRFYPTSSDTSAACDTGDPGPTVPSAPETFSENGEHTLKVRVETSTGGQLPVTHIETFTRTVKLDNPPLPPTGVAASFDAGGQRITLSWNANSEPDVTGYVVDQCMKANAQQACSSSDWSRVANPEGRTTTSTSIGVEDPGAYHYRVAATRPHADGSEYLSSATQTGSPVVLDEDGVGQPPTTVGGGGGGGGGSTGPGAGGGGADDGPGSTKPGGTTTPVPGGSGRSGGSENGRGLPPRLIERTEVDSGYEEALPYGAKPLDDSGGGALEIAARGVGLALVPIAGGLLLFVFSMQMRFLSRRAAALALADGVDAGSPEVTGEERGDDEPVPLLRLGAGGSFISNWKRLLEE